MKKALDIILSVLLLAGIFYVSFFGNKEVKTTASTVDDGKIIIVDAGHGGIDPGKIGVNGINEKDINLLIAKKLQKRLEVLGYTVVMTRKDDTGLYDEDDINKKANDLRRRCLLSDTCDADIMISVHQNSFSNKEVKGGQVFYYKHSPDGKKLAELIQNSIRENADSTNTRNAKANDNYYLLVHTKCPTVIVECGFLSNPIEAELLVTEEYQDKIITAITNGIDKYFMNKQG